MKGSPCLAPFFFPENDGKNFLIFFGTGVFCRWLAAWLNSKDPHLSLSLLLLLYRSSTISFMKLLFLADLSSREIADAAVTICESYLGRKGGGEAVQHVQRIEERILL